VTKTKTKTKTCRTNAHNSVGTSSSRARTQTPKASSPAAVALARKTWMSLGRPAGETQVWVCPLDVGRLAIGEKGANDTEKEAKENEPN
jgi:hypothetical protein